MSLQRYQLLSGAHEGNDYTQEPIFDPLDPENFARARWPQVSVQKNGFVDSPTDLVRSMGSDKFRHVGPSPADITERYDEFQRRKSGDESSKAGRFSPLPTASQRQAPAIGKVPGVANTPGSGPNPTMVASMGPAGAGATTGIQSKWTREELQEQTVDDLKELAEEEEVDLAGARTKDQIIDRLTSKPKE